MPPGSLPTSLWVAHWLCLLETLPGMYGPINLVTLRFSCEILDLPANLHVVYTEAWVLC